MNTDKRKAQNVKTETSTPAPATPPVKVQPLFRRIDWFAMAITTLVLFVSYFLTLAPNETLEDSGELATGSFYAGVPHPPGYPVWTIYSWLFTVLIPAGSIAWRVGVSSAVAASLSCGLLALLVSRGSSMMMEGIEGLKAIEKRWENSACVISGFVAGLLIGFNGFMWSQAVIVEVYPFSVLSFMGTLLCLMRWMYAPQQRRYLYAAFFLFGVCFTNHQTLILAAPGIEIAILAADPKMGRNLFAGNALIYFIGLLLYANGVALAATFNGSSSLFTLYNVIGIGSLYIFLWYYLKTKPLSRAILLGGHFLVNVIFYLVWSKSLTSPTPSMTTVDYANYLMFLNPVLVIIIYLFCLITNSAEPVVPFNRNKLIYEWVPPWVGLVCWVVGAALYLYMPLTSATNPPMNWGYARTWDGFVHAFTRGQYGSASPTNVFDDPFRVLGQILMVLQGIVEEFNWVYALLAIVPFFFFVRMQKRERAWVVGIVAIYISLAGLLTILLNATPDRQSQDLVRVFYASSHIMIAMGVGYAIALIVAGLAAQFEKFRKPALLGGLIAFDFAVFSLILAGQDLMSNSVDTNVATYFALGKIICWVAIIANFVLAKSESFKLDRPVFLTINIVSGVATLVCTLAVLLGNTFKLDGLKAFFHSLSIIFNKDQYALPVFAVLTVVAIVVIFLISLFTNRQRASLSLILVLFAAMPLYSAMSHWFDNEQRNHWFGYWFGHDMFTPPFTAPDGTLSYDPKLREAAMKGPNGNLVYPEMTRNAVLFGGTDPGRFCPTYMIFCESFTPANCKPMDPLYDRRDVYIITQNALADNTYLEYIRAQYFRSSQNELGLDTPFFRDAIRNTVGVALGQDNIIVRGLSSFAFDWLDTPLTKFGAKVEARRRAEGVFPPNEIYTPTPDDSQRSFQDYMQDAQQRAQTGQLRQGEDVHVENGRVQVSGQVAVMMINGLLCKNIFDHNPTNEFFIEESFPLEWMYPYETPFGIIMKINRDPLPSLPDEVFARDHAFWSKYSERLIGNWITYDTPVKDITDFAEKVYLRRDFSGYKGDRKFVRDDDAQKAFSKLRSSIAGVYAYRLSPLCPPEYRPKNDKEYQQLVKEAEFAFKQSVAFCPYSPEAVFRYVNLLVQLNRIDDALIIAKTCEKLDPYNDSVTGLVKQLEGFKTQAAQQSQVHNQLQQMENEALLHPTNFQNLIGLGSFYLQMQQTNRAVDLFSQAIDNPQIPFSEAAAIAQFFAQMGNLPKLEESLEKLVTIAPNQPEPRYDLAALKTMLGKKEEAIKTLEEAINMSNNRLKTNPTARNLITEAQHDQRFDGIRSTPEFQKLVPAK